MPRYVVERTFPEGLGLPVCTQGAATSQAICKVNQEEAVFWVHSYVSGDKKTTFCIYDGPNPEAIRRAAERNALPVDRITEVRVLDPYFYY
jgi:Nickel responsive protein SCO4226-like